MQEELIQQQEQKRASASRDLETRVANNEKERTKTKKRGEKVNSNVSVKCHSVQNGCGELLVQFQIRRNKPF
jgi:hypothetical protein